MFEKSTFGGFIRWSFPALGAGQNSSNIRRSVLGLLLVLLLSALAGIRSAEAQASANHSVYLRVVDGLDKPMGDVSQRLEGIFQEAGWNLLAAFDAAVDADDCTFGARVLVPPAFVFLTLPYYSYSVKDSPRWAQIAPGGGGRRRFSDSWGPSRNRYLERRVVPEALIGLVFSCLGDGEGAPHGPDIDRPMLVQPPAGGLTSRRRVHGYPR